MKHEQLNRWTWTIEQMNNFRRQIPNNTIKHVLYSHTRCLGLHSKTCATQMNTSDNPELWDSQLSTWLFCELTRQLCICLMASSWHVISLLHIRCIRGGFSLAYNVRRTLSRLRQTSSHHPLVTTSDSVGRFHVHFTACPIAITSDYSLTAGPAIHDRYFCNL